MEHNVKFLWRSSYKIWKVRGRNIDDLIENSWKLAYKYNAMHFEILD